MPSPDEFFNQAIDDYRAGTLLRTGTLPLLGVTAYLEGIPGWLCKVPVVAAQFVIHKAAKDKHLIDLRALYNLPSRLASPLAVFDSDSVKGSFVVMTNAAVRGQPIVAIFRPDQNPRLGSFMEIDSIYAKRPASILHWLEKGLLRYRAPGKTSPFLPEKKPDSDSKNAAPSN